MKLGIFFIVLSTGLFFLIFFLPEIMTIEYWFAPPVYGLNFLAIIIFLMLGLKRIFKN